MCAWWVVRVTRIGDIRRVWTARSFAVGTMVPMKLCDMVRRWSLPMCSMLGVLVAFGVVLAWFPWGSPIWNLPLQSIDAPAHYYFVRKILSQGVGAATHLWPNDAYYPPLFHLLAAGLIRLARLFGAQMGVFAAVNVVWLASAGLVWPVGMQLLAWYWTRGVDGRWHAGQVSPMGGKEKRPIVRRPFACAMAILVPPLSVSFASHPFWMLSNGPLLAYALATSLLPFWLYATLRLFDAFATRIRVLPWLMATAFAGGVCLFAHPRIAFTWLLLMVPFVALRLPWKAIAAVVCAVLACAVAFYCFMTATYRSNRYLDPSSWFHTFVPNRSLPEALWVYLSSNVSGVAGVFMAVMTLASVGVALAVAMRPRPWGLARRDAVAVVVAWMLVGMVYVCSTALTGWFANIVTAAWYRSEPRPMTMIPFATLPLLVFAVCAVASYARSGRGGSCGGAMCAAHRGAADGARHACDSLETVAVEPRRSSVSQEMISADHRVDGACGDLACAGDGCHGVVGGMDGAAGGAGCHVYHRGEGGSVAGGSAWGLADAADGAAMTEEQRDAGRCCSARRSRCGAQAVGRLLRSWSWWGIPVRAWGAVVLVAALIAACQIGDTVRPALGAAVRDRVVLHDGQPDEQLTATKYEVLQDVAHVVGSRGVVISDPLNGSMYGTALFGTSMLFPVYNPMAEGNGAIFGQVERAFDSGRSNDVLETVCPIAADAPEYFLSMGPQAPSFDMFTFRQQYDPFHRADLIDMYVADGTLVKVRDYADMGAFAQGWALYRFGCAS